MSTFAVWHSRPVFVTSTFRDMQAERDYLHAHVFPVLAERLRQRFHHLEPIDLRWGVETVSAGDRQAKELLVLKVCLREIKRSRPFLIVLIGDRYGWRPPADRMYAAAEEAGFATDVRDKSVTALEIEYGILDSPEQQKLSRFYFRAPLPYDRMDPATAAEYSDLHSGEPDAEKAHERLEALKQRIRREMGGRVKDYRADWDANSGSVRGLKPWADQVLEDVWSDLDAATRDYILAAPATWQQEESYVLEQFLEEKSRDFVGRVDTVQSILECALSPEAPDQPAGIILTGEAGSGKSALFAHLARKLAGESPFLLVHAAGISARSGRLDTLLRRWVGELAGHVGEADPSDALSNPEELGKAFAGLLARAAQQGRVVCLLDALNQFERTPAARHLTWLPEPWPANARLFATTIPGSESEALLRRAVFRETGLPQLNEAEAGEIVDAICTRYHKRLHPDVRAALFACRLPDGSPACRIPLWVELAVQELLLLDADDFARAQSFDGTAEEKLHSLLLAVVGELPGPVEGLCSRVLERTEKLHGKAFARAFAELIALSRTGWREMDIQTLLPTVTGEKWDPLRFAGLRRSLRAQLVQRGASGQWDFSHAQMRAAVEKHGDFGSRELHVIHRLVADYLESLSADDSLRTGETMYHVIGSQDRRRAARHYIGEPSKDALQSATAALADSVVLDSDGLGNHVEWVMSLLTEAELSGEEKTRLCRRFKEHLQPALASRSTVRTRLAISRGIEDAVAWLLGPTDSSPEVAALALENYVETINLLVESNDVGAAVRTSEAMSRVLDLYFVQQNSYPPTIIHPAAFAMATVARLLAEQGDTERALAECRKALMTYERFQLLSDPTWLVNQALLILQLAELIAAGGDSALAEYSHKEAIRIAELALANSGGEGAVAAVVAGAQCNYASFLLACQRPSEAEQASRSAVEASRRAMLRDPDDSRGISAGAVACLNLADALLAQSQLGDWMSACESSMELAAELGKRDPTNHTWQGLLCKAYRRYGDALAHFGRLDEALQAYRSALGTASSEGIASVRDFDLLQELASIHQGMRAVLESQSDSEAAMASLSRLIEVLSRLVALRRREDDLFRLVHLRMSFGKALAKCGDIGHATECLRAADLDAASLVERDGLNQEWRHTQAMVHLLLGNILLQHAMADQAIEPYCLGGAILEQVVREAPMQKEWARELASVHEVLSDIFCGKGMAQKALDEARACVSLMESLLPEDASLGSWRSDMASAYFKLASSYWETGDPIRARYFSVRCCTLLRELRAEGCDLGPGLAKILTDHERVYGTTGSPETAEEMVRLLYLTTEASDADDRGEIDTALLLYTQAGELATRLESHDLLQGVIGNIGRMHQAKGEYDQAIACYSRQEAIARKIGHADGLARSLYNRAILLAQVVGDFARARELAAEAAQVAARNSIADLLPQVRRFLIWIL